MQQPVIKPKPHESLARFGEALEAVKPLICIHEEFKDECAKCLRQLVRKLQRTIEAKAVTICND